MAFITYDQSNALARYDNRRSITANAIIAGGAGYQIIGSKIEVPIRILKVYNNTDADMDVSFDGVTTKDFIPAGGGYIYDFGSDKASQAGTLEQPPTLFYVKYTSAAPSAGTACVYVVVIYASPN